MRKKWLKIAVLVIVPVLIGLGGAYHFWFKKEKPTTTEDGESEKDKDLDRTYKVVRDDLVIGLRLSGNVNASKKHKLSLQANYRTRLLDVVDENTSVKKGDVLATFETDELKERIDELRTNQSNLEKELIVAVENANIQHSINEVDIKTAEDRLSQAVAARRKYLRFERSNTKSNLTLKIATAETELLASEQDYEDKVRTFEESGVGDESEAAANDKVLRTMQNAIDTKRNNLDNAKMELRAFKRYDNPIKILRLDNELDQATLNLTRVKISTASNLVQKNKQVDNLRNNLRRVNTQRDRYESYLPMMEITAPSDGIVIYADPDRRWGNPDIKPGMDIWKGLIILTIPEMSNLMIDFDLPEQYRSRVSTKDVALITPDSLPTLKIGGKVSHIATLPVNQISWDSASPKVYNSRIKLDNQNSQLVSGMSVQVEIVSKIIKDTVFVPVESIFESSGVFFVYAHRSGGPKEQPVTIGESSDSFVQILDGIEEGDIVYLYRPYQKKLN